MIDVDILQVLALLDGYSAVCRGTHFSHNREECFGRQTSRSEYFRVISNLTIRQTVSYQLWDGVIKFRKACYTIVLPLALGQYGVGGHIERFFLTCRTVGRYRVLFRINYLCVFDKLEFLIIRNVERKILIFIELAFKLFSEIFCAPIPPSSAKKFENSDNRFN